LLSRLKNWDDQESWRDFFDTYGKLIYGLAVKSGFTDAEAQDILQETLISVAKRMPNFQYDPAIGSFKGWLLQITRRRMADQWRKRSAGAAIRKSDPGTDTVERIPDPADKALDAVWDREWQKNLLEVAITRVKAKAHPKQYQMFDLYVHQGWPMALVTSTLSVNAAQVYMAKYRLSKLIKKEIEHLEKKML